MCYFSYFVDIIRKWQQGNIQWLFFSRVFGLLLTFFQLKRCTFLYNSSLVSFIYDATVTSDISHSENANEPVMWLFLSLSFSLAHPFHYLAFTRLNIPTYSQYFIRNLRPALPVYLYSFFTQIYVLSWPWEQASTAPTLSVQPSPRIPRAHYSPSRVFHTPSKGTKLYTVRLIFATVRRSPCCEGHFIAIPGTPASSDFNDFPCYLLLIFNLQRNKLFGRFISTKFHIFSFFFQLFRYICVFFSGFSWFFFLNPVFDTLGQFDPRC